MKDWSYSAIAAFWLFASLAVLSLQGCGYGTALEGKAPPSFDTVTLGLCPLACLDASVTQITPTIAVTAGHASLIVPGSTHRLALGDLASFSRDGSAPIIRDPILGEHVTLYGNSSLPPGMNKRTAQGKVTYTHFAMCRSRKPVGNNPLGKWCRDRDMDSDYGLVADANAGPGFSGGGIYGDDGALVGVVTDEVSGGMFGYWASDIQKEVQPKSAEKTIPWWVVALLVVL